MKKANLNQFYSELIKAGLNVPLANSIYKCYLNQLPYGCTVEEEREFFSTELLKLKKAIQSTFINS